MKESRATHGHVNLLVWWSSGSTDVTALGSFDPLEPFLAALGTLAALEPLDGPLDGRFKAHFTLRPCFQLALR
jgi:hypothetical protein